MFGSASLIFVATLYLMTTNFLTGNPDERMRAEAASFDSRPQNRAESIIDQHSVDDLTGRRPFGLFTSDGRHLVGNLAQLPQPLPKLETFFETRADTPQGSTIYRSLLHHLPNGNLIVVSRNIEELFHFREELLEATLLCLALMAALGIGGGMVIGSSSLRRLDKVTHAIEGITKGDLTGRLPLRGTNDDVDRLVRVVNSMIEQIERLMGEVKGVCDSIAHDLRTPLTRLLAGLERANRRSLSDEDRRVEIENAIAEVNGMLRTFAALMRISEIEDSERRASFQLVDLDEIINDAVEYYEPAASGKGIELRFNARTLVANNSHAQGDSDLLFEAIGNLLDNAVKFTPKGGSIEVELRPGPEIVVSDTGCGIATGDRERVKLRFHRGSHASGDLGNGLGLPLVGAVARLHGLELRIDDSQSGCRVVIAPPDSLLRAQAPRVAA